MAPPAAPAYDYAPQAAYPAYPYDYSDASYGYPGFSYAPYPATYYNYAYGWPLFYGSSVRVGVYWPYRSPAFHGGGRYMGGGAPHRNWAGAARPAPQGPRSV